MSNKKIKELVYSDLYRWTVNINKKIFFKNLLLNPSFKYMYVKRKCQFYKNNNKVLFQLYRIILKYYQVKFGIEIPYETQIGKGFYIGHIGGIVVNGKTKIGDNVNILKGVLIGFEPRGKRKGCPTIGDRVWIGANSVIVGNVKIGNDVLIAPGSFVNFNVPNNSVVIGNPAKVISKDNAVSEYINNVVR